MSEQNYLKQTILATIIGGLIVAAIVNIFFTQKVSVQLSPNPINTDSLETSKNGNISKSNPIYEEQNGTISQTQKVPGQNDKEQHENNKILLSFINSSVTNSNNHIDVCVTIVDENGNISFPISNAIVNIYIQKGGKSNPGLLKSSFVHKKEFQELFEGDSDIITKLNLSHYTDYLAIGKISFSMRRGTLVEGTIICTASITMNIISTNAKTIVKSFSFSVNGNGVTESQAKEEALQKLISTYNHEYSTL